MSLKDVLIVGNTADNPFAEDVVHHLGKQENYSDIISLKSFLNTEFCPRFIVDEEDYDSIGWKLEGYTVIIISTSFNHYTRNDLAMRNFLIARAAKDNGAQRVILLEPDLFFSAQDRGPRKEHGFVGFDRDIHDYKKFDGQPFSSRLYADLYQKAGVDEVVTVHNHSISVKQIFLDRFSGYFHNLQPADVYAQYISGSDIVNFEKTILCSPDKGAFSFVNEVRAALPREDFPVMMMDKQRTGERSVETRVHKDSVVKLEDIEGKDIVVIDDMVRTGSTIVECCKVLRKSKPRRIVFLVTHFYASREGRMNLNDPSIDEIVTTDTVPQILNRDMQGRLRKKMVVLRISRWISQYLYEMLTGNTISSKSHLYKEDMSSKNPRYKGMLGPLFKEVAET